MYDIIILNGKIINGQGNPWYWGDLGIVGDKIVRIGRLGKEKAGKIIDAKGFVVSPGFIDGHSHSDLFIFFDPKAEPKTKQGVTTENVGLDGLSVSPIDEKNIPHWRKYLSGLDGNPKIDFIFDSTVDEVIGSREGGITSLKLRNLKTSAITDFAAQGLFVAIGHTPNTGFLKGQIALDERGYIQLPHRHSTVTNIQGVFACGDSVDHIYRQAVTAAGSGCMAALDCERWLTHERITERWDLPGGEEERID